MTAADKIRGRGRIALSLAVFTEPLSFNKGQRFFFCKIKRIIVEI